VTEDSPPAGSLPGTQRGTHVPSETVALEEWKEARQVIASIDDKLQDLRKFGPTFVTALLTAQGLTEIPLASSTGYLPPAVRLVIIFATDLLICSLFIMERPLRLVQQAAASRAITLEREMGMFLTKGISESYQRNRPWNYIDVVYSLFLGATGALGFIILNPVTTVLNLPTIVDVVATVAALVFVWGFGLRGSRPSPGR
jgi:hypothetical protein